MTMIRRKSPFARRQLQEMLYSNVDAYERNNADENMPMQTTALNPGKDNPPFDAQFDLQVLIKYFSVAAGVYTLRTAAYMLANAAALCTDAALAFFIFGVSDFEGGFKKIKGQFQLANWTYGNPFIYGPGTYPATTLGVLDATALAQLQLGDLIQPATATNGGVTYTALTIVRCTNVAYGTLLKATSSDSFVANRIRYIQNDTSAAGLTQYNNAINWFKLTLFGKMDTDNLSPTSMKSPDQFQSGIIDINIVKSVNKEIAFGSYLNYDAVSIQWSIFVKQVNKLPASL